ncbi:7-cyano-7-deazaguanine synthase [Coleofasciculus sp. LEGE 07081]|nr:7-cyano-7-deazaguanine synthase [Coleofasciculus sp. LEGE 07081]
MKKHHTHDSDYTLRFSPVLNSNGSVCFVDHFRNKESTIGLTVDDREFGCRVQRKFPSVVADLIDLAVAIHASDRLAVQHLRREQSRIRIVLPVRHPELLNTSSFQVKLETLLGWVTGSRWTFDFQKRTVPGRIVEQEEWIFPNEPEECEVALWSGGLDALAGLYTRFQTSHTASFMMFGTGSNDNVYARQELVFKALQPSFPNRLNLCRVPIRFSDSSLHQKNNILRARGVVFTLLGAAYAYLMGQKVLCVYENGIGAINLPYRASAVGLDHSRSVHPLTLLMVSDVVSELLGEEFRVCNPFLFWTKAEMSKALAEDRRSDLPPLTMSCDSPHRKRPIQCGYCSSCILRKQALAASKIKDRTRYVVPHGKRPAGDTSLYLHHMLTQVRTFRRLLSASDNPNFQWQALTREFLQLDDIVDRSAAAESLLPAEMQSRLLKLYQTYVAEWDTVKSRIEEEFLDKDSNQQVSSKLSLHKVEGLLP